MEAEKEEEQTREEKDANQQGTKEEGRNKLSKLQETNDNLHGHPTMPNM